MLSYITPQGKDALCSLLQTMPAYGSEFALTYANHAPMVLTAAAHMGASPEAMQRFFAFYRDYKQLLPFADCDQHITDANWPDFLGQRSFEASYRRYFTAQLQMLGRDRMLGLWLPRLASGVGASAFHALMRTAYGVIAKDDPECAYGLAYWCATWLAMPEPVVAPDFASHDPLQVLAHAGAVPAMKGQPVHGLIWQNMQQSFALSGFEDAGSWLVAAPENRQSCAAAAIALFAATQDFCALHAVTGLHWIRVLEPFHDATPVMVSAFWAGVAGLMNEMDYPALPPAAALSAWRSLPCPEWPVILEAACQSLDEHDLSIAFSCLQEEAVYHDPLYRRAAARRLGLIPEMVV